MRKDELLLIHKLSSHESPNTGFFIGFFYSRIFEEPFIMLMKLIENEIIQQFRFNYIDFFDFITKTIVDGMYTDSIWKDIHIFRLANRIRFFNDQNDIEMSLNSLRVLLRNFDWMKFFIDPTIKEMNLNSNDVFHYIIESYKRKKQDVNVKESYKVRNKISRLFKIPKYSGLKYKKPSAASVDSLNKIIEKVLKTSREKRKLFVKE